MLWVCEGCLTLYAVGLYGGCPHCGHPDFHVFGSKPEDEEHPMSPKISRTRGVSSVSAPAEAPGDEPQVDEGPAALPVDTVEVPDAENGEDQGDTGTDAGDSEDPGAGPARPAVNDPKADWVAWVVHLGVDAEAADALSKKDLIATVTGIEDGTKDVADDGTVVDVATDADPEPDEGDTADDGEVVDLPDVGDRTDDS